jgi:hypothetical protein
MTLFASAAKPPSIAHVPRPPETDRDKYEANRIELHKVEAELGEAIARLRSWYAKNGPDKRVAIVDSQMYCRLGALTATPELSALESAYRKVLIRRAELLSRHAELKAAAGIR